MSQCHNVHSSDLAGAPAQPAASESTGTRRPLVLVIDDDVAVDESFGEMLKGAGYDVHAEASRTSGLDYLRSARPDALILDLHLPDGSGLECLRELRTMAAHENLPVALLTGDYFLDETVATELRTLGARVCFKPVWEDDLLRIVGELMAAGRNGAGGAAQP